MTKVAEGQCPTCGHISRDWEVDGRTVNVLGHKVDTDQAPEFKEDRLAAYRKFRRSVKQAGATDFDQVEWRYNRNGILVPIALFELSRVDGNKPIPETYKEAALNRIMIRDWQGELAIRAAKILNVHAWLILFRWDLSEFWVYNLSLSKGWGHYNKKQYKSFLTKLHMNCPNPTVKYT